MGAELQKESSFIDVDIPVSLRPIYCFLNDAKKFLKVPPNKTFSSSQAASRKKVAVYCIKHGLNLLRYLNLNLDKEGLSCLDVFEKVRFEISKELNLEDRSESKGEGHDRQEENAAYRPHEILLFEANELLQLAEAQFQEGLRFDAMLNYHAACIFFRVIESTLPALSSQIHPNLIYASWRTRQCSRLSWNYAAEFFNGNSCSDTYEIHGSTKLGKGSYGSVYLATHRITGDERAVKVMNVDKVTAYYLRKLHTEIAILKTVDHPNIIKLQEVYFGKRSVYIVTDLCRGGELFELLNSGKNQGFVFKEDRASKLMRDMISAVHYLHGKGIVHRDLKLENFLFEAKSSHSPLVLIDFGLSKQYEVGERLNQRVGSCYYTAPEVLSGSYDQRCDVWSLGVLCYMLLSGSPPFYGATVEDVYEATQNQVPVFPDKKFRHLSNICIDFVKRLLVKDPNERMSTSAALLHPFISKSLGVGIFPSINITDSPDAKDVDNAIVDRILVSMALFSQAHPLIKLATEIVANTLGPETLAQLREEFQNIDKSNDGTLSFYEFKTSLGRSPLLQRKQMSLETIFASIAIEMSHGHSDELHYREYIAASIVNRVHIDEDRLSIVFNVLDPDKNGYINADGIRKVLGEDISNEAIESMVQSGTSNVVRFDAFLDLWYRTWHRSSGRRVYKDDDKSAPMDL